MSEKLKPCPFCGSNGQVRYDYGVLRGEYSGYYVQCSNSYCTAYSLFAPFSTEQEAVEAWNRRVNDD